MAIESLQSLVAKYGANFGITPAPAAAKPADPAASTPAGDSATSATNAQGDTVTLSQEALAYQKAHTSPTGKFQVPNLFEDMMGALDSTSGSTDDGSDSSQTSLLDFLGAADTGNGSDPSSANDPTSYFNTLGQAGIQGQNKPLSAADFPNQPSAK